MSTSTTTKPPGFRRKPWFMPVVVIVGAIVLFAVVVLFASWLRELPATQNFLTTYPGQSELPEGAPVGLPAWLGWQHFLNAFLILLIIRSGWLVRTNQRPVAFWTRNNAGLIRTKGQPKRISIDLWLHLTLDAVWVLNGVVFVILLFATGQWMRVVPTSWDVFPNALSAMLQYVSLEWPHENGWVNYNGLQLLAYFATVFIAAPIAAATGIRMSAAWPAKARMNRFYPVELARAIHFPVMLYFVLFIIVHVTLVLTTGVLRNLNHMYAAQDGDGWLGFIFFAISLVVMIGAWFAAKPIILRPIASLMGKVSR